MPVVSKRHVLAAVRGRPDPLGGRRGSGSQRYGGAKWALTSLGMPGHPRTRCVRSLVPWQKTLHPGLPFLTDPEWDIRMGGPGTSDRFECRLDLQKGSPHCPSQGRPALSVRGTFRALLPLPWRISTCPCFSPKRISPQVSAAHSPMRMPV